MSAHQTLQMNTTFLHVILFLIFFFQSRSGAEAGKRGETESEAYFFFILFFEKRVRSFVSYTHEHVSCAPGVQVRAGAPLENAPAWMKDEGSSPSHLSRCTKGRLEHGAPKTQGEQFFQWFHSQVGLTQTHLLQCTHHAPLNIASELMKL